MPADHISVLPPAERWRPTRAGLIGLWRYWDETFTFHHGRLLLRGPNGSGKSMALELLLPFLLDGDTSPSRLSSAARPRGRLYDRVMAGSPEPSRVGFAWVEFGRRDATFAVGARIRASQSTAKADVDFFTTTLAIGRELDLLDETRTPLSRKSLIEAIGETGRVHDSADAHRAAVREVLFPGFSADRYESVITALLALRKEKLSQNLDLDKLSVVLSEALPPLDDHDVAAVAEGFERLDRRKAELLALERDVAEVRVLARHQRDYARAVLVATAADVRNAETRRDDVTRRERQAGEELASAQGRADELGEERRRLRERQDAIQVEVAAFKESDAYREGAALSELGIRAVQLREEAARAAGRAQERAGDHQVAVDELQAAAARRQTAEANGAQAARDLGDAAEAAGARAVVGEAERVADPEEAERLLHAWVGAQRDRVAEVGRALEAHDRAVTRRQYLDDQFATDEAVVDARAAEQDVAVRELTRARSEYAGSVDFWASACAQLGADRLARALPRPPEDPTAVAAVVAEVVAVARADEAVAREKLAGERRAAEDERESTLAERSRWAREGMVDPDAPPWRSDRAGRAGAPLWRLVDVAGGATETEIDGVEAALTASGLVDAWVSPDGGIDLGPDRADVSLTVLRPAAGPTLASLLAPAGPAISAEAEPPVLAAVVAAVLASIPVAPTALAAAGITGDVVVGTDGSFRVGSAVGRGSPRPAKLLGALARERHRLARLAELDLALQAIADRVAALDRRGEDLDRRRAALDAELQAQPSGDPVRTAETEASAAAARLGEAQQRLESTRTARREAEDAVRDALRALTALAARHGLPTDRDGLRQVEHLLQRLWNSATTWARRRRDSLHAAHEVDRATRREAETQRALGRAETEHQDAERQATEVEQRVAALESTVGVEFAELSRRIGNLETEQRRNAGRARELTAERDGLLERLGDLKARVEAAAAEREDADAHRERTHRLLVSALASFAADAGDADMGALDHASAVLAAARAIAVAHPSVEADAQAMARLSERVTERVHGAQSALGSRVAFDRELVEDGWWVLRTTANGVHRKVTDLATSLARDLAEGKAELAEEEERLFEQTLAGSVRRALADRIREANQLTDAINTQLGAVRTAAGGVEVRLKWDVDPEQPDAVKAARALLLRDPAGLSDSERASLQDFVRARVDQARADLEANAPWEARLRETLDYRAWHRFQLQLAHRDWEGFVPATPRRLQKLSTGERSIALHLPMIASVAAHYTEDKGQPSRCPRLILLDELFAGVDVANRAQLFGTFTTWDLDAVFTSDHEWCQYESLNGIAVHYLHPPSGDEPVTSTRFTWDGRRRRIDPSAA
jgi:uncharacterized protein (TIGR02680 family)